MYPNIIIIIIIIIITLRENMFLPKFNFILILYFITC